MGSPETTTRMTHDQLPANVRRHITPDGRLISLGCHDNAPQLSLSEIVQLRQEPDGGGRFDMRDGTTREIAATEFADVQQAWDWARERRA